MLPDPVRLLAMSVRHETTEEKLAWLRELSEAAEHDDTDKAVARQHERGKLLASERIDLLLDAGPSSSSTASSVTARWSSGCATSGVGATRS